MPILRPATPRTKRQKQIDHWTAASLLLLGLLCGFLEARQCSRIAFGYVAGYSFLAAWVYMSFGCVLGSLLLIYWRTRWIGVGLIVFGVFSLGAFYGEMEYLLKTDQVAWKHEPPPTPIGPDQRASVIVYFKHGVTAQQIEAFNEQVLQEDAEPRHEGKDYPDFFSEYLALLPDQADGFDAVALTFYKNAPRDKVEKYVQKITADPRVEKIVLNAVPLEINKTGH